MPSPTSILSAALLAGLGCATAPPTTQSPTPGTSELAPPVAPLAAPLAVFAAKRVVVVPVQRLRAGSLEWSARTGEPAPSLRRLDDEITFALAERGLGRLWMMPGEAARALRRNPTFDIDPLALDVGQFLVRPGRTSEDVTGPAAFQLRAIAALGEARYVLVPTELRFERAAPAVPTGVEALDGAGRALLRAVLVDTRLAQVLWRGEVASDVLTSPSPAIAASLASRLADLFTSPATPAK